MKKDDSVIDKILHSMERNYTPEPNKGTGDDANPRRNIIYKHWVCDTSIFFSLRSRGVPILTAYFLSEGGNNAGTHRMLLNYNDSVERELGLNTLKIL